MTALLRVASIEEAHRYLPTRTRRMTNLGGAIDDLIPAWSSLPPELSVVSADDLPDGLAVEGRVVITAPCHCYRGTCASCAIIDGAVHSCHNCGGSGWVSVLTADVAAVRKVSIQEHVSHRYEITLTNPKAVSDDQ